MAHDIHELLRQSVAAYSRMPADERRAADRLQAISFVYGNLAIENAAITYQMVADAYDRMPPAERR